MTTLASILIVLGLTALAWADVPTTTQTDSAAAEADLAVQEQQARSEAAAALARLDLVLARKALREHQDKEAARRSLRVLNLLTQVPAGVDVSPYELQAEGILAKVARAGVDVEGLRREAPVGESALPAPEHARTADVKPRQKAPLADQRALEEAYRDSEARALVEAHEARVIPQQEIDYPRDWPEITRKRAAHADALIARSPSWWDDEGREWYVGLYDISDLIAEPAFHPAPLASPLESTIALRDREALRQQSYIFRGDAYDLAAGLPLLRYFGGVFDTDLRPRLSQARQRQIIELIKAFTQPPEGGAQIVPLSP